VRRLRRSELATLAAGVACLAGVAAVVAAAHAQGHAASSPLVPPGAWRPLLFAGLIGGFAAYAAGCLLATRSKLGVAAIGAIAAGIQLVPLAGPLLLSSDAQSYTTYGSAHDPYTQHPGWATSSVYGPLWTFVSEPIARLSRPELGFRVLAAACTLAIAGGAAFLSTNRAATLAFVGWNPLLALHGGGGGHNDSLMIAFVVLALVLERRGHVGLAGVAWAASLWIKWVTVVFWALWLVFRWRRRERLGLGGFAAATAVLAAAAFARFGSQWLHVFSTAANEARRPSSIGLPAWLGHLGVQHRVALGLVALAFLVALAALLRAAWRGRLELGVAGGVVALAQERLNPWFGFWSVGLAGTSDRARGRVFAVALTALLLIDVLPR
jgi:glycosyl transferase family 87